MPSLPRPPYPSRLPLLHQTQPIPPYLPSHWPRYRPRHHLPLLRNLHSRLNLHWPWPHLLLHHLLHRHQKFPPPPHWPRSHSLRCRCCFPPRRRHRHRQKFRRHLRQNQPTHPQKTVRRPHRLRRHNSRRFLLPLSKIARPRLLRPQLHHSQLQPGSRCCHLRIRHWVRPPHLQPSNHPQFLRLPGLRLPLRPAPRPQPPLHFVRLPRRLQKRPRYLRKRRSQTLLHRHLPAGRCRMAWANFRPLLLVLLPRLLLRSLRPHRLPHQRRHGWKIPRSAPSRSLHRSRTALPPHPNLLRLRPHLVHPLHPLPFR